MNRMSRCRSSSGSEGSVPDEQSEVWMEPDGVGEGVGGWVL